MSDKETPAPEQKPQDQSDLFVMTLMAAVNGLSSRPNVEAAFVANEAVRIASRVVERMQSDGDIASEAQRTAHIALTATGATVTPPQRLAQQAAQEAAGVVSSGPAQVQSGGGFFPRPGAQAGAPR